MLDELIRLEQYKKLNPNELTQEQFQKIKEEIKKPKLQTISDEYFDFKLWNKGILSRQESFANFVIKKLEKSTQGKKVKVLEVGGGRTARLSRILKEKGFDITCIDYKIEPENAGEVECIKGKFDYTKFDLTPYDYVIAQEPCDATEHVVRACMKYNKPFMMTLCGVPHKLISGETPKDVDSWYDYLINISSENIILRYVSINPFFKTPILRSKIF